jgi:glycosyltransferase involved in cell wall biosynthesis
MRVGVVLPVHGFPAYLAEALDGVLGQDRAPDAVVVVDDASPEPIALHPDHAARCTLVRREQRGGPAAARASGLEALEGVDAVAPCDADDAWRPGKLAAQVAALEAQPAAAVCVARAEIVGPDGRPTGERWAQPAPGAHAAPSLLPELYVRDPICLSGAVVRAGALRAAGGFESALPLAEDWDLWLRLVKRGATFFFEPRAVVAYRRHPSALTAGVAALARAQLELHRRHAGLVDGATRRRVEAADLRALAAGLAREGDHAHARAALREAAGVDRAPAGARVRGAALAVPGVRALVGRRRPYG